MSNRWPYPASKKHLAPQTAEQALADYREEGPKPKGKRRA